MFTARTCLVMVSPNMHILSPVVSFSCAPELTGSHTISWSHLHHVVTKGVMHKLLVVIYTGTRARVTLPSSSTGLPLPAATGRSAAQHPQPQEQMCMAH